MTDLESAMPALNKNVKLNENHWQKSSGSVKTEIFEWGKELPKNFTPDIVLLTDCVYYEEVFRIYLKNFYLPFFNSIYIKFFSLLLFYLFQSTKALLDTLEKLCSLKGTYVLMSQEQRDTPIQLKVWQNFKTSLKENFNVTAISEEQQHPIYSSADIDLLKITKE